MNSTEFARLAKQFDFVPVSRRFVCDGLTPVLAFHRIDDGGTAALFESVIGGENVGRYSFLAASPFLQIKAFRDQVTVTRDGQIETFVSTNPLFELRKLVQQYQVATIEGLPPFAGGAIGYASYDVIRYFENLPHAPNDDRNIPDLAFALFDQMIVFDNVNKTMTLIVLADCRMQAPDLAQQSALNRLDALAAKLQDNRRNLAAYQSNLSQKQFESAVSQCVEYIRAGDIFQVVISQRLALPLACDPFEVYRTLRVVNPSPFMFFLRTPDVTLVGSSPEIMCRVINGKVTVRPLAGTRRRGQDAADDKRLAEELLQDPKERAEHVMLVDLGRNDVGRVAKFGSIELPDVMVIERYSHVMHISSTVNGQLRDDCDAFDALAASLPAGTVSGAPKVRAMQIIDELEPHRRGPYAGAVGYIDFNGNMDTCIALRTLVVKDEVAYVQAGAGIVADSEPAAEYQETLNKAKVLLKAIELTHQRVGKPTDQSVKVR
jgi:anthranilate synthase component I